MPDPTQMTVFNLMKSRLQMLGERQKVIAENVANISTPGYVPRDIDKDAFARALEQTMPGGARAAPVVMSATRPGHMAATAGANFPGIAARAAPDSETTLDGNAVVVEEQMMKIAETRMDFDTMVGLYQKSLSLLRLASRTPTR